MPLIIHSNYRSAFLCVEDEIYKDAMVWRDFDQLQSYLGALDETDGAQRTLSKLLRRLPGRMYEIIRGVDTDCATFAAAGAEAM